MYKIYKLVYEGEVVYIGQTITNLMKRKHGGYRTNDELQKIYKDCDIILIEETDDVSRERYWIDFYGIENLLNKIPGKGRSEDERKEYKKAYKAKWDDANREYKRRKGREWFQKNKKQKTPD